MASSKKVQHVTSEELEVTVNEICVNWVIMIPELNLNDTGIQHDKDETVTTSTMCDTPRL
jgi:hypothetical protein